MYIINRLDSLMLIFVEYKLASKINIYEVIEEFKTLVLVKIRHEQKTILLERVG